MNQIKLNQDIMFLRLSFNLPKQTRKVQAESDIDPDRLRASAKLYSGTAFGKIKAADAELRGEVVRLAIAIPACFRGSYILPAGLLDTVLKTITDGQERRNALIESFLMNEYAQEREAARAALRDAFRETDFPDAVTVRSRFRMEYSIFRLDVPEGLPPEVRQAEIEKLGRQIDDVASQVRDALRETLADLVGHLADRLAPDADGGRKRLCASTIENLREFLDTVNARNITSDEEIAKLSDKARAIIGTTSAEDLRKGGMFADRIRSGLAEVKREIDGLIEREGGRKIDLDLE